MNIDCLWIEYGTGMVYMKKKRYETAEEKFNKLLAIDPSYGYAYAQLGYIRKYAGKKEESIAFFNKAIKYLPDEEMGIYQSGLMHVECINYDEASDQFFKVLELNPVHIDAILNLGFVHGRKDDFEQAEKLIKDAYQKDTTKKDGFARLGWIKAESRDWLGAFEIMNRDYEENRLSPGWQVNLAQIYSRIGEMDRAIKLIEATYSTNPGLKDGYARLGWIKAAARDWDGAFDLMNRDMKRNRISPVWQINLAQMLGRKGEWNRGIQLIKQAYESNQGLKDGCARLGWIKTEAQDWRGTISLMAEDLKQKRLSSGWHSNLARILIFNGEYDNALKLIEDLYLHNRDAKDGYAKVGWACFLSSGDESILRNFITRDADLKRLSDIGIRIKAWEIGIREDSISAGMLMDSLYSTNPLLNDGFAVMGWLRIEKGDSKEGIALMEKDCQLQRLSPEWKINFSYQLAKAGQIQKAQDLFTEVMDLEPYREEFPIGFHLCPTKTMTRNQFQLMMDIAE